MAKLKDMEPIKIKMEINIVDNSIIFSNRD